jgi:hypothetical protein
MRAQDSAARKPSHLHSSKIPTEVILYGFATSRQWAAVDRYERAFGRICEDYARDPPEEDQKYKRSVARSMAAANYGPRTKAESIKAMNYAGGEHWIKVTFESAEIAEMAVTNQPLFASGAWVHCEYWRNTGPKEDKMLLDSLKSTSTSFEDRRTRSKSEESLTKLADHDSPFSYSNRSDPSSDNMTAAESPSLTPTTYPTNGTATSQSTRRRKIVPFNRIPANHSAVTITSQEFTEDRYVLRPATEALLPIPSRWERILSGCLSLLPSFLTHDQIGDELPVTDDGHFDWSKATLYWSFWYYIDYYLGTDVLGMKEED